MGRLFIVLMMVFALAGNAWAAECQDLSGWGERDLVSFAALKLAIANKQYVVYVGAMSNSLHPPNLNREFLIKVEKQRQYAEMLYEQADCFMNEIGRR
jgi:hypothetical protein